MKVFYPPIPASDGTSMAPPQNAPFTVHELSDATYSNPLPLETQAGTNGSPLVTTAQGVLPGVYVISDNYSHNFKSGNWVWRRDSFEGAQVAVEEAMRTSESAAAAAREIQAKAEAGEFNGAPGKDSTQPGPPGKDGLPGVNAVPTSQAVAEYATTPGNPLNEALASTFIQALTDEHGVNFYQNGVAL